jgi:ribosomal protein S18 acetylase RimI-like enzyme
MTGISTRLAGLDDVEAVASLFDAYRQFYKQPADLSLARRFIHERLSRDESVLFVAEDETKTIVGFCQLYPTFCSVRAAPTYTLYDLFVIPEARGSGAGRALMLAAEAHGLAAGVARMDLSTARDNTVAQALYESLGWLRDEVFFVYNKRMR